jgi:hypothetical protein
MAEKITDKESAFDSVTWEAQKYDAAERKFQEASYHSAKKHLNSNCIKHYSILRG